MIDVNFQLAAKKLIADTLGCRPEEVYCCSSYKILQHIKGTFSSDVDNAKGMYWEITYNGIRNELYFDHYQKLENKKVNIDLENDDEVAAI